ncbi:polyketide synthase, partial [Oceaniglobus roseus]|uniref:polyketide synthase n=1 Tax=Oceaniglobus roseus TaxID=1737570 RepID=UPI0015628BA5
MTDGSTTSEAAHGFDPARSLIEHVADQARADGSTTSEAAHGFDPARSLIEHVADQARLRPDAPAILLRDRTIRYGELLERAGDVAAQLMASGVGRGDLVGLAMSRSDDALIAMLGALRAGAVCVPLDPAYSDPTQLAQIVGQVRFAAILQPAPGPLPEGCGGAEGVPRIALSQLAPAADHDWPRTGGGDPACIVFTSGTTGTPKGVVLPNRGLAAFTLDQPVIGLRPDDIMLHASSLACDGGLIEVWSALMAGAALAVVETPRPALPEIAATMTRHRVTVTSQYVGMHNLIVAHHVDAFATVRLAMAGGDVLSPEPLRRLKERVPGLSMVNIYGPSETTCISLVQEIGPDLLDGRPIPIGRELTHEHAFVVDETLAEVPDGTTGELLIGGAGGALGYHGMPEKTAAVFIEDPRPGHSGRVYRTGDMALRRPSGTFEFFGRADRQIKLGGRRIELDGIEHVFRNVPGVHLAIVEAVTAPAGDRRIGLALQPEAMPTDEAAFISGAMEAARQTLHAEFLPRHVILMAELPVTKMGKPDRKAVRAALEAQMAAPRSAAADTTRPAPNAQKIRATVARIWDEILHCGPLADSATFFDAGGTSLQLIDAHARLQAALKLDFDLTLFFERPRLGDIAAALAEQAQAASPTTAEQPAAQKQVRDTDIAVIGYAARVPGAATLDAFWARQREGANLIHRFAPEELEDDPARRADPHYVPARSVLDDVEMFDARFFGILPREAERMDPQARVFLEMCVAALDSAACDPARTDAAIGVYAGSSTSTYMLANLMQDRRALADFTDGFQIDNYTTLTGNITDTLSSRVAYKLDLKGPAMTVHTACSTGLTAIAQAVTALRAGQCDMALAGGISITFPQRRGYVTQEGGMSSPDGLCRPFDAQAGGTVFGHGGGVLVLKPLARALADGDRIAGVIRGVGLNNDGADKISFTAPSVTGQAGAIRAAHRDAGIAPSDVSFVECHGTATPLGDPIEVRALQQAFGRTDRPVALGSVKGSIGHLDAGAGAVSVIRTLQAMQAREIPPMANFIAPNPRIDFAAGTFFVPDRPQPWDCDGPRIAGVSGFGVGGTNVHIVLEEAPGTAIAEAGADEVQILPLSAKSPEALAIMASELAGALDAAAPPALPDVALTLQDGRTTHAHRLAIAAASPAEAARRLLAAPKIAARPDTPPVAFLFPGQGAQYPGMGSGLYADLPAYRRWIDEGCEILAPLLDRPLLPLLDGAETGPGAAEALKRTALAQPALVLTQYATAQAWMARGIRPGALLGHSVGEFAAAALAGVMSFEDALHAVAARGRLMQEQPEGVMLSVRASLDDLLPHLGQDLDLAAENAPKLQVVAGPDAAVAALEARLDTAGLPHRRLHTSHAFHGRMMDPVTAPLSEVIAGARPKVTEVPMISAVTGAPLTDAEATDPGFWAGQARATVRFAAAVRALAREARPILLEVGAGNTLTTFAAQGLPREGHGGLVQSLPDHARSVSDARAMAEATATLWSLGAPVDWPAASRRGSRKLDLPGTVFLRRRHWIAPPDAAPFRTNAAQPAPALTIPEPAPLPVAAEAAPAATLPPATPTAPAPSLERSPMSQVPATPRTDRLVSELAAMLTELSGEEIGIADAETSFLELGFDSLFMGQMSQALARTHGVELSFRSLLSDYPSIAAVAAHLDATLPPEAAPAPAAPMAAAPAAAPVAAPAPVVAAPVPQALATQAPAAVGGSDMAQLMQSQMQVMQSLFAEQLRLMGGAPAA